LREHLASHLPEPLLPSAYVLLPELPLTFNGKVDRRALPAPEGIGTDSSMYVAPSNRVEEELAKIWADVLRLEQVGVHDDFFVIGGHSLLATKILNRIDQAFGIELTLREFFNLSTVARLAELIGAQYAHAEADELSLLEQLEQLEALSDEEVRVHLANIKLSERNN
jgi:acyl carrier protein